MPAATGVPEPDVQCARGQRGVVRGEREVSSDARFRTALVAILAAGLNAVLLVMPAAAAVLEGYASRLSVVQGGFLELHVRCSLPAYEFSFWRVGDGVRRVGAASGPQAGQMFTTPPKAWEAGCGWPVTQRLPLPWDMKPGAYAVRLESGATFAWIPFVVRPRVPGSTSRIVVQLAVNTWQAYNPYGGKSLYRSTVPGDATRAYRVSLDRPYGFAADGSGQLFAWEAPFLKFLEREGIPYEVCTNLDLHQDFHLLDPYQLFISVGHDEYWSKEMFDALERYVDGGGNIAFLSGNAIWWQVRFENSGRTMVCYKSAALDPLSGVDDARVTVNWPAPPVNRPPAALLGVHYSSSYGVLPAAFHVANPRHWIYQGVAVDSGQAFGYPMAAFEVDCRTWGSPARLQIVAHADLQDTSLTRTRPSDMAYYERTPEFGYANPHGGKVFAGGSVNYVQGLMPGYNPISKTVGVPDPIARQITLNVIDRMACKLTPPRLARPAQNGFVPAGFVPVQWWAATAHRAGVPVRYTLHWQATGGGVDSLETASLTAIIRLQAGMQYRWWVTAATVCGARAASSAATFSTGLSTDAAAPALTPALSITMRAGAARIHLQLPAAARVALTIYDAAGRETRRFEPRTVAAGYSEMDWDLLRPDATRAPSGLYFVRADVGTQVLRTKLIVVH